MIFKTVELFRLILIIIVFLFLKKSPWRCSHEWPKHFSDYNKITYLLTYLLIYLLTPWCIVLLEKLTGLQLVKKFPVFHRTRRFITALTSVRHLSLYWASPIQSIYPHPTSWRSTLILSTHLCLGLPSGLLHSGFPSKTLYTPLSSPIRATCPAHLILLDFITRTILGEEYKSFSSSLYNLLHSPITSFLLGPNILLNTITKLHYNKLKLIYWPLVRFIDSFLFIYFLPFYIHSGICVFTWMRYKRVILKGRYWT